MDKYCGNCGSEIKEGSEFCLKCGRRVNVNVKESNFNPDVEVNEKPNNIIVSLGVFLLMLAGYILLPSLIASVLYYNVGFPENLASFIGSMSFVVILMGIFYKMFSEKIKDYINNFKDYFKFTMKWWGIGLLIMYISNIIINFVIFGGEIAANEELNRSFIQDSPIIGFMSVVIFAPFVEEMIFRFGVRKLSGRNKYFPIISALAFGIPHVLAGLDFSNFFTISNLLQFTYVVPYGGLGYAFGVIYNKTDNIFCSMTSHCIHNFMCFLVILLLA